MIYEHWSHVFINIYFILYARKYMFIIFKWKMYKEKSVFLYKLIPVNDYLLLFKCLGVTSSLVERLQIILAFSEI